MKKSRCSVLCMSAYLRFSVKIQSVLFTSIRKMPCPTRGIDRAVLFCFFYIAVFIIFVRLVIYGMLLLCFCSYSCYALGHVFVYFWLFLNQKNVTVNNQAIHKWLNYCYCRQYKHTYRKMYNTRAQNETKQKKASEKPEEKNAQQSN